MDIELRGAGPDDVTGICHFGAAHIPPHYTPLIGAAAAAEQVRAWWAEAHIRDAVAAGTVVVALPCDTKRVLIEHVAANERAAAFYERQGFRVDRVEPVAGGDPRRATVWRVRDLG